MRRRAALVGLVVCLSLPMEEAIAQSTEGKWYATLQYGRTDYDVKLERGAWWGRVDDATDEATIGVGYELLPQLAARVMYRRTSDVDAASVCPRGQLCLAIAFNEPTRGEHWSASLLPKWSPNENWDIYATLGVLRWDLEPDGVIGGDSGTDFLYGAGVAYQLSERFSVNAEFEHSNMKYSSPRVGITYRW